MQKARKGEIAVLVLKYKLSREGVRLGPDFRRDVGNTAKAIGISFDEAMEFVEEMVREQVEELFAKKSMTSEEVAANERMGTQGVLKDLEKKYDKT